MQVIHTPHLTKLQQEQLFDLWNDEYPVNLMHNKLADFEAYLATLANLEHMLLVNQNNEIKGWAFLFSREQENWFALIIAGELHKQGYGTRLLNALKTKSQVLNGWVINHDNDKKQNATAYLSPLLFYLKQGFVVLPDARLLTEKISALKIRWEK